MTNYPDVAAWDLDYTVWPCYCDTHITPPLRPEVNSDGQVLEIVDARGYKVALYKEIPRIMEDLKMHGVKLLSASRTWAPDIAIEMLKVFKIKVNGDIVTLFSLFDDLNWGDHSKVNHIRSGVKHVYGNDNLKSLKICLFDDESRNRDVERYGVKYLHIKDPVQGPDWKMYESYLASLK